MSIRDRSIALLGALVLLAAASSGTVLASDLVVRQVDASAVVVDCRTAGESGTVAATIQNIGVTATGGPFDVVFFQDENGNGAFDDGLDLTIGTATVPVSLLPGAQAVASAGISATAKFAKNPAPSTWGPIRAAPRRCSCRALS